MNISPASIIFILVVGVVLFGPDKLPELARKAARVLHYVRTIANQAQDTVRTEFGPEFADFDIRNPRQFVTDKILGEYREIAGELEPVRSAVNDVRGEVGGATAVVAGAATSVATSAVETTVVESQPEPGVAATVSQVELRENEQPVPGGATAVTPSPLPYDSDAT